MNSRRLLIFGPVPGGFAIALAVWLTAFVCRAPFTNLAPGAVLALLLAVMTIGAVLIAIAGRDEPKPKRIRRAVLTLIVAGLINVLLVGSVVGAESSAAQAEAVAEGVNPANRITMTALLWIPGSLIVSAIIGLVGGAIGTIVRSSRMVGRDSTSIAQSANSRVAILGQQAAQATVIVFSTFCLILVGGVVTSAEVGLSVPDWPNSYGWNMFLFPFSKMVGGIYYEHAHRLIGSLVGLETLVLFVWLWVRKPAVAPSASRRYCGHCGYPIIGLKSKRCPECGHAIDAQASAETQSTLPTFDRRFAWLGTIAFILVCIQGILGGARVTLVNMMGHNAALKVAVLHATHAQLFLVSIVALAWWLRERRRSLIAAFDAPRSACHDLSPDAFPQIGRGLKSLSIVVVLTIILQTLAGAILRHFDIDGALHVHLTGAVVVFALITTLAATVMFRVRGTDPDSLRPVRACLVLFVATAVQVALGFTAWWVTARYDRIDQITSDWMVFLTAGHVVGGALVLAVAAWTMLEVLRLGRIRPASSGFPAACAPTIGS